MAFSGTLTADQSAQVASVGADWTRLALSSDRCDRPAAEAAVRAAYRAAGWDEPRLVVWMDSPLGGVVAAAAVREKLDAQRCDLWTPPRQDVSRRLTDELGRERANELWRQVWAPLEEPIGHQIGRLGSQVLSRLRRQLRDEFREDLGDELWIPLVKALRDPGGGPPRVWDDIRWLLDKKYGEQVWDKWADPGGPELWSWFRVQLGELLGDQVERELSDGELGATLRRQLGHIDPHRIRGLLPTEVTGLDRNGPGRESMVSLWSQAWWIPREWLRLAIAELPEDARLEALASAVSETGWWWPMHGAAVLTDRPTVLSRDRDGRLHHATGPALRYADGYQGHWWHGTAVPADLVEGTGWSIERILAEPNAEIRRCAVERFGWVEFVSSAGLRRVGPAVPDPGNPGQVLALYDLPARWNDLPFRILLVTNASADRDGSRRRFALPVPRRISDPVSAAASLFDVSSDEYLDIARAT